MTNVSIVGDTLRVALTGWDRIWALSGGTHIPLAQITAAVIAPAGTRPRGLRAPGAALPGVIYAGTWRGRGYKEFWNVRRDRSRWLLLTLSGHDFARVVLELPNAEQLVADINRARAASRS